MASNLYDNTPLGLYRNRPKFKWVILGVSVAISMASAYYIDILAGQIKAREKKLIVLYANTLEYFSNQENNADLDFIFDGIILSNKSIPVVMTDDLGNPLEYKNIGAADRAATAGARRQVLLDEIREMEKEHEPLLVTLRRGGAVTGHQFIYYKNSRLLAQLKYYPLTQFLVIGIFGMIAFLAFDYSKVAEQNKVWVGLAKETAHQLGTPLSSLMAWVEYLKSDAELKGMEMIAELEKDVERLNMIASRFSHIGSEPILESTNVYRLVERTLGYLKKRISTRVGFTLVCFPNKDLEANINKPLFEWVIENLCKNAVDAMGGEGKIHIKILKANEGQIIIDISDTGKGIPKSGFSKIFQPGFTTKKRGWGLGLTLVKRIIENYHKGKIFVKRSDANRGATFRISLKS